MDRIEAALRALILAAHELADIIPAAHTAKAVAYELIDEASDILDKQLALEHGDAPGPSAEIAANAEAANRADPDNVLDHPEKIMEAPAAGGAS